MRQPGCHLKPEKLRFINWSADRMPRLLGVLLLGLLCYPAPAQPLTRVEAAADLDTLQYLLDTYASYPTVNGYPYLRHLDSLKARLPASVTIRDLGLAVHALVGRLQDAHSLVEWPEEREDEEDPELPFPTALHDGQVVAASTDGCGLLATKHPYLAAINNVSIERLLAIAGLRYRGHSPQRFLSRAADNLKDIPSILDQAGVLRGDSLAVTLTNGIQDTTLTLSMAARQPGLLRQNEFSTRLFSGGIAYLRIEGMWEDDAVGEDLAFEMMRGAMESRDFAESRGMIIDVRGNTGGSRDILDYLLPYFIEGPLAYNAAVVRHDTLGLAERRLFAPDDERRSPASRVAAETFAATFRPLWTYPWDDFLDQLYVAVVEDRPTPYDYSTRPVVVLMDAWSFSATDVFLAAMGEIRHVTLMGTPSAGGSGRSRWFTLSHSGIGVRLSTMASFQPGGQLYDGYGVTPDTTVSPTLEDVLGQRDSQLGMAVRLIRESTREDDG